MTANNIARTTALSRQVAKVVLARETPEGVGVTVRRSIGTAALRNLDPFLMLDHFKVKEGSGFAEHPHRGFSTVTYMLEGAVQHEDFKGHKGVIRPGDVQWMQAGRGILHSEMPLHEPGGPDPSGMQLWLNLPKANKLDEPLYQEYTSQEMPYAHPADDVVVKVVSGEAQGSEAEGLVTSLIKPSGGCWYFDVSLKKAGTSYFSGVPAGWTSFVYILEGSAKVGDKQVDQYHVAVLSEEEQQNGVQLQALSDNGARIIHVAGQKLNEPVYQMGPFVMTNRQEIMQAVNDFQLGVNGFEGAREWKSVSAAVLH